MFIASTEGQKDPTTTTYNRFEWFNRESLKDCTAERITADEMTGGNSSEAHRWRSNSSAKQSLELLKLLQLQMLQNIFCSNQESIERKANIVNKYITCWEESGWLYSMWRLLVVVYNLKDLNLLVGHVIFRCRSRQWSQVRINMMMSKDGDSQSKKRMRQLPQRLRTYFI